MAKRTGVDLVLPEGMSPYIIFPHPKSVAESVTSWKEVEADALFMVRRIQNDEYANRLWPKAYAMAHTQVSNTPKNFFVVNRTSEKIKKLFKYDIIVNPKILGGSMSFTEYPEGCMSDPYSGVVKKKRFVKVNVEYFVKGWFGRLKKKTETVEDFKAFVFQHEIDHLQGKC